ncbi:MAG: glycosyltransferase family 4 protein [Candidatus Omnitrophica bacterium]|nr:glycosyltransferase family 4 protein [Candidatus Omnitrophota bacterium]
MDKPSILYITLYLPLQNSHGGGNRMFEQLKCLSDKYNISLISFLRDWEESGVERLKPYCRQINTVNIKESRSKSYSFAKPGFLKNYYSTEMAALINKKISADGFDIVQFEYLPMAQYNDGLKMKAKSVLVEHQLGFLCLKKEAEAESNFLKKAELLFRYNRLKAYEIKAFKNFDQVVFISRYESIRAHLPQAFVSPMGVDTEYFKPQKVSDEDIDLVFTGNFDNFQNEDAMIYFSKYIWPLIKVKRPLANIKIIGVHSKERLGFLKNKEGIEVLGCLEDIRMYLNRAKVFILPARIGGGMRGKLLEALSMGKPVVSTAIGAEGYAGDILKAIKIADRAQDFADKTLEILEDKNRRQNLGIIGRIEAEKTYKWEHIFSNMDTFYESILRHD